MSVSNLSEVYTEQFRNHPEGHALYFKVPASSMKPGSCGYFNDSGHWRPILQIAEEEPKTLALKGWKPPARILTTENQTGIEWPIKLSESVQERRIEANLGAAVPDAPASGGFNLRFSTKRGAGAVLITAGQVRCSQLKRDLDAFKWVTEPQNMRKLLEDWEELSKERRTLWMIAGTYSAKSCALSVLHSPESSASVGIQANVADVVQAKATAEWWKQGTDQTWIKYKDDSGVVLFMSGIAFRTSFFHRSELHAEHKRRKQNLYRDASTSSLQYAMDEEQDPLVAVMMPEYIGKESRELEAELESRFSGDQSESDASDEESD
ncbi:hypothetical protein Q7P37_002411 [Cladosporium fusiforme]